MARAAATTHFKTPYSTEVSHAPVLGRSLVNANVSWVVKGTAIESDLLILLLFVCLSRSDG